MKATLLIRRERLRCISEPIENVLAQIPAALERRLDDQNIPSAKLGATGDCKVSATTKN